MKPTNLVLSSFAIQHPLHGFVDLRYSVVHFVGLHDSCFEIEVTVNHESEDGSVEVVYAHVASDIMPFWHVWEILPSVLSCVVANVVPLSVASNHADESFTTRIHFD